MALDAPGRRGGLRALALLACSALAGAKELAVVRPFASQAETSYVQTSFASWGTHVACSPSADGADTIDLFLVYSRNLSENTQALAAVNDVVDSFRNQSAPWHSCFRAVHILAANLSAAEDVYNQGGQMTDPNWVSGPNAVFRFILRSFIGGVYDAFFLMELDSVPKRPYWLDQFRTEVNSYPNAAIRGSHYRGDKWDAFTSQLPSPLLGHINGNAIYYLRHPFLAWLSSELHVDASTSKNSVAYDVRLAELTAMARSNATGSAGQAWEDSVASGEEPYIGDSLLIGNYANTLLNGSFDGGEFIAHVALSNIYAELDSSRVTLAVHHFDNVNFTIWNSSIPTVHPFRKIVVLTQDQAIADSTTEEISTVLGKTTLTYRRAQSDNWLALCELADLVTTDYFVFTDTYHVIASPVSVLMSGSQPVLPYLSTSSTWCQSDDRCTASIQQARDLFGVTLSDHYDKFDTLFSTSRARTFCQAWQTAVGSSSYSTCSPHNGPSADDFIAWHVSQNETLASHYKKEDREIKGWRSWSELHTAHPVDSRSCAAYKSQDHGFEVGNISACTRYVEQPDSCMPSVGCMWRPLFQTGKCIPHNAAHPFTTQSLILTTTSTASTSTATTGGPPETSTMTTTSTTTTTVPILATVASILIPINTTRVTKENVGAVLAELKTAVQAVQNGTAVAKDSVADNDVRIELTEESGVDLASEPTPEEKVAVLAAVRSTRCGNLTADQCDVQEPNATSGLKAEQGVVLGSRRLQSSAGSFRLRFVVFIIIRDAADLSTTTPISDPSFATSFQNAVVSTLNATANQSISLLGNMTFTAPVASTLTVISITLPENSNADLATVQQEMTNTSAITAAIVQASGGTTLILQAPTVDLCLGRTCGGNGVCSAGICQCNASWIGNNCLLQDPCFGRTCSGNGACSAGICTCNAGWSGNDCQLSLATPTPVPTPSSAPTPAPVTREDGVPIGVVVGGTLGGLFVLLGIGVIVYKLAPGSAPPPAEKNPPPPVFAEPPVQPEVNPVLEEEENAFWV